MIAKAQARYAQWDANIRRRIVQLIQWYEGHEELGRQNREMSPRMFVIKLMTLLVVGFAAVALLAQSNADWPEVDGTQLKVGLIVVYVCITIIGLWSHWAPLSGVCSLVVLLVALLGIGYGIKHKEYDAGIQMVGAILFYLGILFVIGLIQPKNWTKESLMYVLPFAAVVIYQVLPDILPEAPVRMSKLEGTDWFFVGLTNTAIARGLLIRMKKWMLTNDSVFDTINFIFGQYFILLLRKVYPVRISTKPEEKKKDCDCP